MTIATEVGHQYRLTASSGDTIPRALPFLREAGVFFYMSRWPTHHWFVLANTEELHEKIIQLQDRISSLENGLATLQATHSSQPHPLLREDLLDLKAPLGTELAPAQSKRRRTEASNSVEAEQGPEVLDALGTLTIESEGRSVFYGGTAGAEFLLKPSESLDVKPSISSSVGRPGFTVNIELQHLSQSFPFTPIRGSEKEVKQQLRALLPTADKAWTICEFYFMHATWLYNPIPRSQFIETIFNRMYRTPTNIDACSAHQYSVMFGILAVGVQLNTDLPAYHQDAEQYHMLARAALALDCSSENTTISAIQSILLMCYFCQLTDNKDSPMHHWSLIGLGMKLAVGIGLHRDGKRWDLDPAEAELRRALWWELRTFDAWVAIGLGRPPSIAAIHTDTEWPKDPEAKMNQDGLIEPSYQRVKFVFARLLLEVLDGAFSATAPSYEKVLKLHRRLREFEGPPHLHVPGFFGNKYEETSLYVDNSLQLERHTTFCVPETILMHLHRSFFARAISESPDDPLQSRYAESVIAIHEAVSAVRNLFNLLPDLTMRFWLYWSHAFSGGTILAALVIRCPGSSLSVSALKGLDEVSELFTRAQNACRARRALPTILKLRERAHYAFKEYHSGHPTIISLDGSPSGNSDGGRDENTLLGGRTRVITFQGQSNEYRSGQSTSSTLSPYSDESGSVASGVAVGDSLNDHHSLDPYMNTYTQGINIPSSSLSAHHMDPTNPSFDPGCDAPLVTLHPGMLGPQSPTSYYSYPPTGNYQYPGQQHSLHFTHDPDRQPPTPNNVDYTWQALMSSIGVQGRQA
ncbi:putative transcriptional regulatory protein C1F7,11c OS=Schizosaccharomyces pombe (strain 972 / ATCC 24843) GN=SPAC1F7.11c PE=4 SV=1 [Rhizoctonia solani AG-1 IB]|uniref:Putative transcriptional regulatory protein C1F7,11c n=1 Tax=Thanatephorus cucumeris (strain AG1-IB / isolate 7/3/14) TaxID=1108050 RepID=A0A0B7G0H1_THACB|nr:putative transcriptional regulatory protein C1F7,11c OS=Schizosaccharomyces pombe (strain 972 / ATCC 24843) GN=SPAC1F7.11c PE=4 SV=1 [Rhizoctonia solani AG-1 IB]